jgi:D-psicose/D-tagatose/L-ribulose 3-epimerase
MTPSFSPLSAFLTSLPLDFADAVRQATQLGFTHVDVVALRDRPAAHLEALAETGALVQCAAVGRDLPAAHALDVADAKLRRATVDLMKQQIADAARLGAISAYIMPGHDAGATALTCFAEGCALLADYAAQRMVHLCIEHIPGRALPTAAATLTWLESIAHPNLFLLLDVGHCLISGEVAGACVRRAGARLGYVHLDDNDGAGDLHWPLLTGRLTPRDLEELAAALRAIGYRGGLALELNAAHGDALVGLRASKEMAERLMLRSFRGEL